MRRFFAFIIMVVSIVAAIIFNTQAVMDGRLLSLEYGGGRELVYSLTQREGGQQVNAEKLVTTFLIDWTKQVSEMLILNLLAMIKLELHLLLKQQTITTMLVH